MVGDGTEAEGDPAADLPPQELARRLDASIQAHLPHATLGVGVIYVLFAFLTPFYSPELVAPVLALNVAAALGALFLFVIVRWGGLGPRWAPLVVAALLVLILAHLLLYLLVAKPGATVAVALGGPLFLGFAVVVPRTRWYAALSAIALVAFAAVLQVLPPAPNPWVGVGVPLVEAVAVGGVVHVLHRGRLVRLETLRFREEGQQIALQGLRARAEGEARRAGAYAEDLERSNEALQEFASIVSHDLREPLRMVRSYLQLILRRSGERFDDEDRELFAFAADGAERMDRMIRGLLSVSRVETSGEPLRPTELDEVLDEALQNLEVALDESGAEVTRAPLPRVVGDHAQLVQLLQNLVANAIKFTRDGEPPRIHISTSSAGGACIVEVQDHGRGIPEAERERVFRPFHRGTTADDTDGTGIGLAVCRRIVSRHGGDLRLESTVGEGTTVRFTLSLAEDGTRDPSVDDSTSSLEAL